MSIKGYNKTIICLANTRRHQGSCISGLEYSDGHFGKWIRPVSQRQSREISDRDQKMKDGTYPKIGDIITIPMLEPLPYYYQTENHLIDTEYYWERVGSVTWDTIANLVEEPNGPLWLNSFRSYNGINDRVPESLAKELDRSLYLIRPETCQIQVLVEGAEFNASKQRVRVYFRCSGFNYKLIITDRQVEDIYRAKGNGRYKIEKAVLSISLGEVYKEYAYKLAALITPEMFNEI